MHVSSMKSGWDRTGRQSWVFSLNLWQMAEIPLLQGRDTICSPAGGEITSDLLPLPKATFCNFNGERSKISCHFWTIRFRKVELSKLLRIRVTSLMVNTKAAACSSCTGKPRKQPSFPQTKIFPWSLISADNTHFWLYAFFWYLFVNQAQCKSNRVFCPTRMVKSHKIQDKKAFLKK